MVQAYDQYRVTMSSKLEMLREVKKAEAKMMERFAEAKGSGGI